ncbi:MAG: Asp-tRNA(Asn)/Glu-tRNA(Gln) amidotransferase subunit GatA [Candidatus Saccharibacteria bacterium]|nr:Asp-tRNA(Asn)/Glu-tRNA(Gln) amidotransferase subunit GatA [Candidatus Saccharibacteria bacterium]
MKTANKKVTAERLVKDALEKAKHFADYNIFTFLDEEGALARAREIDARIAKGEKVGRLAGVPYALKDNFLSPRGETTAAAHILGGFVSPITATSVEKIEAEGAIMIGRVNMDAFAHGSSTENSYYGPTLNSHDRERVAGGSSGGSAVAVALDIVEFALGTDTGGSIRQPAAFNGIYGFKPTYGTVSRYGVVAMASSTDCISFMAQTPDDIDLLMSIASGQDPKDMTTLPDYYNDSKVKKVKKIGVVTDFDNDSIDIEIRKALKKKCELLKSKGYEIVELSMPSLKYALNAYYVIVPAEVASNLSRYDGIRYGFRSEKSEVLNDLYKHTRDEGFMPENKRRIMVGNFVLSSGFYDAYFLQAAKVRTLIVNEYAKAFEQCDFILMPISPNPPFKLGEKVDDPVAMYMEDMMSVSTNLAGIPGLAVPAGETTNGLPIGLQLVGPRRSDKSLIEFSKELN